jgi:deoxyribonuclease-4
MKIGLKLWSTNNYYMPIAETLYSGGQCAYVELFFVPGSFDFAQSWKNLALPYIIHAPHTVAGLNPACAAMRAHNKQLAEQTFAFADKVGAEFIIFHPGMSGDTDEVVTQFKAFGDCSRILIENKPYHALHDETLVFVGHEPCQLTEIISRTGSGFCLDFGHAVCAANSLSAPPLELIEKFLILRPRVCHISDGLKESTYDRHLNLGHGTLPLKDFIRFIPQGAMLTIETDKASKTDLDDFLRDVSYVKTVMRELNRII